MLAFLDGFATYAKTRLKKVTLIMFARVNMFQMKRLEWKTTCLTCQSVTTRQMFGTAKQLELIHLTATGRELLPFKKQKKEARNGAPNLK